MMVSPGMHHHHHHHHHHSKRKKKDMSCRRHNNRHNRRLYPTAFTLLLTVVFVPRLVHAFFAASSFIIGTDVSTRPAIPCGSGGAFGTPQRLKRQRIVQAQQNDNDAESSQSAKDLFDYFDPLLSPHAYPDGISPDKPPVDIKQQQQQLSRNASFGLRLEQQPQQHEEDAVQRKEAREEKEGHVPDLFEYFDPLLSPHAYPDGISPDKPPVDIKQQSRRQSEKEATVVSAAHFGFNLGGNDGGVPSAQKEKTTTSTSTAASSQSSSPPPPFFDPTLSPHLYTNGTPDTFIGDVNVDDSATIFNHHNQQQEEKKGRVIGILLMDHGSRNQASNQRLHKLAALYQESNYFANNNINSNDVVIVQAAHMEIASPSVPQGLENLLQRGDVELIICHPFFLSPAGRHVSEDIPRIIEQAVKDLNIDLDKIPVVTTNALGAQTDVMLSAIHSSILQTTSVFNKTQ